ncbi:ABC transporter ATP-binding protein [Desulfitobacterium sp. Sab5]|uniref:ABC transporter ATP-binding protein n=1 Tax=Desulfitobacterium nosdiversum TaxID=3375356 RepID=UPI003CE85692
MTRALEIQELTYTYPHAEQPSLSGVNLGMESGRFLVIMGASGAGKTTLTLCLNGLIPQLLEGQIQGKIEVDGLDVSKYRTQTLAQQVGIVFQDPESQIIGLTVEEDVAFGPRNFMLPEEEIQNRVREALSRVRLSGYELRKTEELSGGETQRLAIAGILAMRPNILVLDEPTSELDPAGRSEVFATLDDLRKEKEMTILIVEHSAEEILNRADEVVVMRKGKISWQGNPFILFRNFPLLQELGLRPVPISVPFWRFYQQGWITAEEIPLGIPEAFETLKKMLRRGVRLKSQQKAELKLIASLNTRGAVAIKNLQYCYRNAEPTLKGINLAIASGEFLALVGANGAGKSTLTKHLNGLLKPTEGEVWVSGKNTKDYSTVELACSVGYVFQNPDHQIFESSVEKEIAYGLKNAGLDEARIKKRVEDELQFTGLECFRQVHPLTLGKGQRQILAVASILALQPEILVIDEPTAGLDWTEAQRVMNLVKKLHEQGTTIIMITHDMEWVAEYAERVVILHQGKILLEGDPKTIFAQSECLREASIIPPQVVQLSQRCAELGLQCDWLRGEELVKAWVKEGEAKNG